MIELKREKILSKLMEEKFNSVFEDFFNTRNNNYTAVNTASILLFKEYLKRMRLWYERLDILDRWFYIYRLDDGHNIIKLVAPELLNNIKTLDDFKNQYYNGLYTTSLRNELNVSIVYGYLCWELFKDYPQLDDFRNLVDPYEPVIKILQRGNNIRRGEMKTIEIDNQIVFSDFDFEKVYLPSFNDEFLDFVNNKSDRLADSGIPNPERVDELWEEFQKDNGNK